MNTFDAIDIVYSIVTNKGLPVFKLVKPSGDEAEYIVINSLPVSGDFHKKCLVNVNIHVKDIKIPNSTTAANTSRLKQLAALYAPLLEKNITTVAQIYLESQGIERDNSVGAHFINYRLLCNLID